MSETNPPEGKGLLKNLVGGAKSVTDLAASSVTEAADAVARVIPDAETVKRSVGRALILGGRTLIDPKAVVGEFAIQMGERLAPPAKADDWLALAALGEGFAVLAHGPEAAARAALEDARKRGAHVLLCRVMAADEGRER